jgi:hypothetical protein
MRVVAAPWPIIDAALAFVVWSSLADVASEVNVCVGSRRSCAMHCMVIGFLTAAIAQTI